MVCFVLTSTINRTAKKQLLDLGTSKLEELWSIVWQIWLHFSWIWDFPRTANIGCEHSTCDGNSKHFSTLCYSVLYFLIQHCTAPDYFNALLEPENFNLQLNFSCQRSLNAEKHYLASPETLNRSIPWLRISSYHQRVKILPAIKKRLGCIENQKKSTWFEQHCFVQWSVPFKTSITTMSPESTNR